MPLFCNNCGSENIDIYKFCDNCGKPLQQPFSTTDPLPTRKIDVTGWTLHKAAEEGELEIVKELISKGADINAKNNSGCTPLHSASEEDHKEVVELLISQGANVNAKDNSGNTPLYDASFGVQKEVSDFLISKGADVNAKNNSGRTPLHSASSSGKKELAKLLISQGADVNATDKHGSTPLHGASSNGHKEVADLLISKGSDVNATDNSNNTPLNRAIEKSHKEVADLLIFKGGKKKKGDCFITTATCLSLQKPDNCYELNTFRKFRDNWLSHQPDGNKLISEYYSTAPAIVEVINNMPQREEIYNSIWTDYLSKCLYLIEGSQYEEAKEIYINMVNTLALIIPGSKA